MCWTLFFLKDFIYLFIGGFIYLRERSAQAGGGAEGVGDREADSLLSVKWSLMWGSIPGSRDHTD